MQTNRSNAALAARAAGRSTSPLDGPGLPLSANASPAKRMLLHNQLGALNIKGASPANGSATGAGHVRSKSSGASLFAANTAGGSRHSASTSSTSPAKQPQLSRHKSAKSVSEVSSKSARTSPVKPVKSGHAAATTTTSSKTPSRNAGSLGRSAGTQAVKDTVAAGGLGRMDIAGKDWDSKSSSNGSAGNSPQKKKLAASTKSYDRFIPSRENSASSGGALEHSMQPGRAKPADDSFEGDQSTSSAGNDAGDGFDDSPPGSPGRETSADQAHTQDLTKSLGIDLEKRILSFSAEPPPASNEHASMLAAYARGEGPSRSNAQAALAASQRRRIPTTAEKVLDAPGMVDDYYLNLLDWSSTNLLAIALEDSVYIWDAQSGEVGLLCSVASQDGDSEEIVCSVKFSDDGSYLAVGTSSGPIQIYDLNTSTRIRTMAGHATRVPTLSWSGAILSSGSRDGSIWNSDVRQAQHKVGEMHGHRAEVCGLAWRKDMSLSGSMSAGGSAGGMGLIASGGNDNVVNVWDGRMLSAPKMVKNNHTAAVKAIAWCPWQSSLLATGGGSSDRTIHFWNTTTSARMNSLVTPSQVTSLIFNPHSREILSSHGLPDNQLSIWSFPTLTKIIDIPAAHETRILHSCISPDGTTVATASSDENLKFWKVFEVPKKSISSTGAGFVGAAGKGNTLEGKHEADIGRRGRTGINIR